MTSLKTRHRLQPGIAMIISPTIFYDSCYSQFARCESQDPEAVHEIAETGIMTQLLDCIECLLWDKKLHTGFQA